MRLNPEESLEWLEKVDLRRPLWGWQRKMVSRNELRAIAEHPWPEPAMPVTFNPIDRFLEAEAQRIHDRMLALGDFP